MLRNHSTFASASRTLEHNPGSSDIILLLSFVFSPARRWLTLRRHPTRTLASLLAVCSSPRNLLTDVPASFVPFAVLGAHTSRRVRRRASRERHRRQTVARLPVAVRPLSNFVALLSSRRLCRPPTPSRRVTRHRHRPSKRPPFVVPEFLLASFTGEIGGWPLSDSACSATRQSSRSSSRLSTPCVAPCPVHRSPDDFARHTPPPPFVSRPSRRRPSSSVASSPGRSSAFERRERRLHFAPVVERRHRRDLARARRRVVSRGRADAHPGVAVGVADDDDSCRHTDRSMNRRSTTLSSSPSARRATRAVVHRATSTSFDTRRARTAR